MVKVKGVEGNGAGATEAPGGWRAAMPDPAVMGKGKQGESVQ